MLLYDDQAAAYSGADMADLVEAACVTRRAGLARCARPVGRARADRTGGHGWTLCATAAS